MKYYASKLITVTKNETKNTFDVYYKNDIVEQDAEKFATFEDKILAISKGNYLSVYAVSDTNLELKARLRKDGTFENALVFIDEVRYIISFKCTITCYGRC